MNIKLLHHSPLWLSSHAIRMSHDSHDKSDTIHDDEYGTLQAGRLTSCEAGDKDKALIERIGNKFKHKSVMEQLVYWFDIDGISRACLQELARHRTARLTVKSSRYTLNELKNEKDYNIEPSTVYRLTDDAFERATKYVVLTSNDIVNESIVFALEELRCNIKEGYSNDIVKYCLPEAFKTRLQWQIDGRNLQNFLELRTSKDALWEIRELAYNIFDNLPEEHKYLYNEYIKEDNEDNRR